MCSQFVFVFLHAGVLKAGAAGALGIGMGTARNPGTGPGAGWVEFPEDGEQLDHDLDRWGVRDFNQ